ncbi:MAG: hypothetical protein B5M51_01770, partial [Anaerolinea sp. 4484_236]
SVATVSRALGGYSDIAKSTQERVKEVAGEMGYHPNIAARRLQKQKADTIGFIIPTHGPRFADPFFTELLTGIGNEAAEQNYDLLVSTRAAGSGEMKIYQRMVSEQRVDGLLVVRTRQNDQRIRYLLKKNFPFVAFGRSDTNTDYPYLDVDSQWGIYQITQHLIDLGHEKLAYISAPEKLQFASHRLTGYKQALEKNNIPYNANLIFYGELTESSGYKLGHEILSKYNDVTAIIASNDLMALGTMNAAQELGYEIGEDIAITGFDDIPLASHAHPPLTTVQQPIYDIGRQICRMLIQILTNTPAGNNQILLKPQLIIRASSKNKKGGGF